MVNNNPIKYSDLISPDNSITDLIKQLDTLSDSYTNALQNIKNEAVQLASILQRVSGATEEGRRATKKAADDADRLARAQKELAFAESENAKRISELNIAKQEANQINKLLVKINQSAEGSYNRLSAQYSLNKIYINNMTKAEREAAEAQEGLISKTKELYQEMNRLQQETGKSQLNVGNYSEVSDAIINYGDRLKESLGLNNAFGESLLSLGKGGEQSKAIFQAMADGAKALGKTLLSLMSNPVFLAIAGIAAAGTAFKFWYDYNSGLVEATRLTQQFTQKQGDDLKAYRNQVQAISETFNVDFKETLIAANAVAQQFGISADNALKLIQDGFIAGGDANGEFLDSLKEYPAYFKEAGISADQFIAIVAQTNKMGIFSDKGVDAIKEANIRLREMTTATAEALGGIGISSDKVQEELQTGAKTTFDIMQEVSMRLNELPSSASAVGTAIADIFGDQGEDAGLQYLRTLKDIELNLDEVKKSTGELGALQEELLQSQVQLDNTIAAIFDQTGGGFETLTTKVKVFVNDTLTSLLNKIIGIYNAVVEWYNGSVEVRTVVMSLIGAFQTIYNMQMNIAKLAFQTLRDVGDALIALFTLDFSGLNDALNRFGNDVVNFITDTAQETAEIFQERYNDIDKKLKPITIPVVVGNADTSTTNNNNGDTGGSTGSGSDTDTSDKDVENIYKRTLSIRRKMEDEQLALEKDEWEKRRKQTQNQYTRQIEDLKHQLATEKNLTKADKEAINDTIKALEQQQTNELLKIEEERQLKLLEAQKRGLELRLAAVKTGSEEEKNLQLQLIQVNKDIALRQNAALPESERQDAGIISAGFDKQSADTTTNFDQNRLNVLLQQQQQAEAEIDLLDTTEKRKTLLKLKAEKERLEKTLALQKQYSNSFTTEQVKETETQIQAVDQKIKETEQPGDIYDLFGLNLDDEQKEAINESISFAMEQLTAFAERRVEIANQNLERADKEVESAQQVLNAEIAARDKGYANNVQNAQKELELAKRNQQKALQEQQKALKQQQAIQTVQEMGNLVASTALIWSQVGFPGAIPAIAIMWASFAASKIKAAQLAKQQETYGEGTVELLSGGSHQSGNDIDLGTKPDGTRRRAEGGEFFAVINKRNSRRFRRYIPDVIKSFNNGTFAHKYLNSYNMDGVNVQIDNTPNLDEMGKDIRAIRKQNESKRYIDGNGNTVIINGNHKRIIKRR